ncbi:UvrD-helicase domain-containing protein [Mycobacterium sp.]|uniref:UvrD-helicase domain-containing protein n=1 Tax=Mycobacterium sp. TaxID=1785 RepID=UPI003A89707E
MEPFDLLGPLPADASTTVLEASAGTGKTFALAGLVTRYIAEGRARLDEMLLITFGRAASQELRDRVRRQINDTLAAFDDPATAGDNDLTAYLIQGDDAIRSERKQRLRDALAGVDTATIATIHQFCQLVLNSLGVAGDSDSGVTLVEDFGDLVTEIIDDLYLARFGHDRDAPTLGYDDALNICRAAVKNPSTQLRPASPQPGSPEATRVTFARDVLAELEKRKRQRGILGYDDLLSRLADALSADDSPARLRMKQHWPIVMVDEFQDTDLVQWQVLDRAFNGQSTLILIGDPKQAIYGFRGGDIATYLRAAATAGDKRTLATNWRSDSALVDRLQVVLGGVELGAPEIVVRNVRASRRGHRLTGAPRNDPFRLRVVRRTTLGHNKTQDVPIDKLRTHIGRDLAADIGALLAGGAMFDGEPLQGRDIAVIVERHRDAAICHQTLTEAGIPAVHTGNSDVFQSEAAEDWLALLEAFDQPHRPGLVRAAAATMFFGLTAEDIATGGDTLTDEMAQTLREWADQAGRGGVAAIFEAARIRGMSDRVLSCHGGERRMTDAAQVTQLLQAAAHREHFALPALRDWLRAQRDEGDSSERNRRLDSDAAAVQIMTIWASKGLQYPIVYLPFAFNRYVRQRGPVLFHDRDVRCLHIGGKSSPDFTAASPLGLREAANDASRLTYVAMTRAQSQVVAWWAPAKDEPNGGLSRLLRGRRPGEATLPDRCEPARITDDDARARLREWEDAGGPVLEDSVIACAPPASVTAPPSDLAVRQFQRTIDTGWRRTSYSGLVRAAETAGAGGEPEVSELDDEAAEIPIGEAAAAPGVPSPMAELPTGAKFGSLVHAVLETADPLAADLTAELEARIRTHSVRWPVNVADAELAAALVPMHDTPLGPLAGDLTLRQIGLPDRLRELDFEFPLAGGDRCDRDTDIRLADVGRLVGSHLPAGDPLASYADRLLDEPLCDQSLRGYLSGSIDVVLRIPDGPGRGPGHRYLVADYKTNWLAGPDRPLTAADYTGPRLAEAMLHSDYPLQAMLYSVVLHRFLRWRQPGYDPARHLGGVLYLFVRGMCGPGTPVIDGHPAGVFSWAPPTALVSDLSELLDARGGAG